MSLHFDSIGHPLTAQNHPAKPSPQRSSRPTSALFKGAVSSVRSQSFTGESDKRKPLVSSNRRHNDADDSPERSVSFAPTVAYRQSSVPITSPTAAATPAEALDQAIFFLGMVAEQLQHPDVDPVSLQREVLHLSKLLTTARANTTHSAIEVQKRLQRDIKRRATSHEGDDGDREVLKWISAQYANPSATMHEEDDDLESPKPHKPESFAAQSFRSTMLCMRWVRRVRESVHRRALLHSPWESIQKLHLSDPIAAVLARVDEWDFDLFALERLAGKRSLSVLAYHIFEHRLNAFTQFGVRPGFFANFIAAIEDGYKDVPYHSHLHGADVLQNTYYFLSRPSQSTKVTKLDVFAGCIAAAVHDFQHPGTNNMYQIATASKEAMTWNDRSVLENMHVSEAFKVMNRPHHNILSGLKPTEKTEARNTIIFMVLATDMSAHFKHLGELKSQLEGQHKEKPYVGNMCCTDTNKCPEPHLTNILFFRFIRWSNTSASDRQIVLETALHAADLGNPTKSLPIYLEWTGRVMEEFYRQGDLERKRGLPISQMMDRTNPTVEKSQIGFISFVVSPLYETFVHLCPEIEATCLQEVQKNKQYFLDLIAAGSPATTNTTNATPTATNGTAKSPPQSPVVKPAAARLVSSALHRFNPLAKG